MPKITVVTAVWKRHAITRAWWQWYAELHGWWPDVTLAACVAGTDDPEHERMALEAGAIYVNAPNVVGRKFNAALHLAKETTPDAVLVMGSDDVFGPKVAAAYCALFADPMPYIGLRDFYFYDTMSGATGYWPGYYHSCREGEPAGGGRVIPRRALDACDWILWDDTRHHGMDGDATRRLRETIGAPVLITAREVGGVAVSLKGPDSLWKFWQIGHRPTRDNVLARLPDPLRTTVVGLTRAAA